MHSIHACCVCVLPLQTFRNVAVNKVMLVTSMACLHRCNSAGLRKDQHADTNNCCGNIRQQLECKLSVTKVELQKTAARHVTSCLAIDCKLTVVNMMSMFTVRA